MRDPRNQLLKITSTAAMMALSCVLTLAVRIPSPTKGYLNLGDCAVLFGGWLLGPVWGSVAGGVGSALADLFAGYPVYVPGTLIIKAAMAFFVSLVPARFGRNGRKYPGIAFLAVSVFAEAFMVAGYWLYEAAAVGEGFAAAFAGVSGNVVQGIAGAAGAYFLTAALSHTAILRPYGLGGFGKGQANMFIIPDTQEELVPQKQWERVQRLRENRRRPTKGERQGWFSGLLFCADCGSKLHFTTCKNFDGKQDRYVCSKYKSGRGDCGAHYIREDLLREIVLERIQAVNEYVRRDVEGFEEEWFLCRRADWQASINDEKKRLEKAKKRITDLDTLISRCYEDAVLGNLSRERYVKMTQGYEEEQEHLKAEVETLEEWVENEEEMDGNMDSFLDVVHRYMDVPELTPTIVNEYTRKINVHAPDKSSGHRQQKVQIYWNFLDEIDIPDIEGTVVYQRPLKTQKTA